MEFLQRRNPRLQGKFRTIAVDYMREGRSLGVRWDYALFQMVVETNSLKFTGDVRASQNNFAGLGATGGGVRGENFRTVSEGVRAHLQHLMLYAGMEIDNPVAERTRKVRAWKILDPWRRKFGRPITYGDVGRKWAPGDRQYGRDIARIGEIFYARYCDMPDPAPELVAVATGGRSQSGQYVRQQRAQTTARRGDGGAGYSSGAPATRTEGGAERRGYGPANRAALGAQIAAAAQGDRTAARQPGQASANYKVLNNKTSQSPTRKSKPKTKTSAATFATPSVRAPSPPPVAKKKQKPKCRVWTASYGGTKAVIIKSQSKKLINYTVLDVNPDREARETSAYIAAYAKGGVKIGDYRNKDAAMKKAFKLCPNG